MGQDQAGIRILAGADSCMEDGQQFALV